MQPHRDRRTRTDGSYRERLLVPVSWWLLAVPVIAVLGAEVYACFGGWIPPAISRCSSWSSAGFLLTWGASHIEVADGALRAGRATLPLDADVGEVCRSTRSRQRCCAARGPTRRPISCCGPT